MRVLLVLSSPKTVYSNDVVREVLSRLAAGESKAGIARKMAISRGLVRAIASGKRRLRPEPEDVEKRAPVVARCRSCGRKIELPCRACALELRALDAFEFDGPDEFAFDPRRVIP